MNLKFYFSMIVVVFSFSLHASQAAQELEQKATAYQKRINPALNKTLFDAAQFNNTKKVEELLSAEEIPDVNATDKCGWVALMYAAMNGNPAVLQALIDAGANVNATNPYGYTALILAARMDNKASTQILLEAGANPMLKNQNNETALMVVEKNIQRSPQKEWLRKLAEMLQLAEKKWTVVKVAELKGVGSDVGNLISQYAYPKFSLSE